MPAHQSVNSCGGFIGFYDLSEWWFATFSENERQYIDDHYQRLDWQTHRLTQGNESLSIPASQFLNELSTWFRSPKDRSILKRIHEKVIDLGHTNPVSGPGYFNGRHYTTYVTDVEELKRNGLYDDAELLLIELIYAVEAESRSNNLGVAPWYYEELAKIYRKRKDFPSEILILEKFAKLPHAAGVKTPKLLERLGKARMLNKKKGSY